MCSAVRRLVVLLFLALCITACTQEEKDLLTKEWREGDLREMGYHQFSSRNEGKIWKPKDAEYPRIVMVEKGAQAVSVSSTFMCTATTDLEPKVALDRAVAAYTTATANSSVIEADGLQCEGSKP